MHYKYINFFSLNKKMDRTVNLFILYVNISKINSIFNVLSLTFYILK